MWKETYTLKFEDLMGQAQNDQKEEAIRESGVFLKMTFDVYVDLGFTEEQAMQLTLLVFQHGLNANVR